MQFIMLCSNHRVAYHHQCFRPSWERSCDCDKRTLVLSLRDGFFLREGLRHEDAKDILGATCSVLEDKAKVWHVKMLEFVEQERTSRP